MHIWKTRQSSNFILTELSSISRNVTPRESNFRMFPSQGEAGPVCKEAQMCFLLLCVHYCQHDSIMLGPKEWHREREHANNCIQGFLQTNTMSLAALLSREPRRQIDTPNLGLEEALTVELTV